jgi:hypothetical protein
MTPRPAARQGAGSKPRFPFFPRVNLIASEVAQVRHRASAR